MWSLGGRADFLRHTYDGVVTDTVAPMPLSDALPVKKVLLAAPRGYCAGVDRAVITVEKALELYGAPVYVRKQIVRRGDRRGA